MSIKYFHGWGCDESYWDDLKAALKIKDEDGIYITHSLGTLEALNGDISDIKALIAINGFTDFVEFTHPRILGAMRASLKKNAAAQMYSFYKSADMRKPQNEIDTKMLFEGLEKLERLDMSEALETLSCPVLALLGDKDRIVPIRAAKQQWLGREIRICDGGGHNLPQTHTDWVVEQIQDFLK